MDALYQEQILSLARLVRQCPDIAAPTHHASMKNPTCGDEATVKAIIKDDVIEALSVHIQGCALCEAGAGLLLQQAANKSLSDMHNISDALTRFLKAEGEEDRPEFLAFTPVQQVKNRHKCVSLSFQALQKL